MTETCFTPNESARVNHPQQTIIDSLRDMIRWLESHPQDEGCVFTDLTVRIYPDTADDMLRMSRGCGTTEKIVGGVGDSLIGLKATFGPVVVQWFIDRDAVCKKVVTKKVIPAKPEYVIPATPETVVEEVVWECPESIFAGV